MRTFAIHPGARTLPLVVLLACFLVLPASAQEGRPLTFTDLMQLREIEQPSIAANGRWIAFTAEPDRGDPEVIVRAVDGDARYVLPLARNPIISPDGAFVAARLNPSMAAMEAAGGGEAPRRGLALLTTATGAVVEISDVRSFAFSDDGAWLAYHEFARRDEQDERDEETSEETDDSGPADATGDRAPGTTLNVRELASGRLIELAEVRSFAFDEEGRFLAYAVASTDNTRDGLYVRDLRASGEPESIVDARAFGHYAELTWAESKAALAFVMAVEDKDGLAGKGTLMAWYKKFRKASPIAYN